MQVTLNTNINQSRPNFKASFAKDRNTKEALKILLEKDPITLYKVNRALKRAKVNDVISAVFDGEYSCEKYIRLYNESTNTRDIIEAFFMKDYNFNKNNFHELHLSNGKKLGDYFLKEKDGRWLSDNKKHERKMYEEAGILDLYKKYKDKSEQIIKLRREARQLDGELSEIRDNYLKKELGL